MRKPLLAVLTMLISVSILAPSAVAQQKMLRGLGGAANVFVWKDKKSHTEGMTLIQAGVHKTNPALLMRLIACMVPSGTMAVVTDAGFATHDIW